MEPKATAQAVGADLLVASDDTLFDHPSFRYAGLIPRLWSRVEMMMLLLQCRRLFWSYKQYWGEYMGSLLTGLVERMLPMMKNDKRDDMQRSDRLLRR